MVNCRLVNTNYAFEYCHDMDVEVATKVDSILNPGSGTIKVKEIGEKIIEDDNCDSSKTSIIVTGK